MSEQELFEKSIAARLLYPACFTKVGENPILGWNGAKDTDYVDPKVQQHWTTWQAATAQVPEGCVVVKPALDSTAKLKMIGEYSFSVSFSDVPIFVPWATIKQIYKDGVSCMIKAAQENDQ